ncbi:heat shock factor protein isoform X1 [Ixodes scapularis]|uniref:heat shock factor protein isoform X1 n=1 Tax=Ixodes scapularis TaxID=6945 RepID=UPI001161A1DF|nr:heat shock factor protein isoform X1 [Ixodes scapularis]
MHTTEVGVNNVPAFLVKLWKLVEDENCNDLISWNENGQSFIIHNQTQFAKELLPLYFKHSNMASFIRQLNMYGFRKVANIDQGALKSDRESIEFFHNFFIRGQECMLEFIKRKVPAGRNGGPEDSRVHGDVLKELLSDVGSMQGRQEHVDQLLTDMKKENEALWREVAVLRQKHHKQQQIVEKLIQFLVTLVQANRNITVKRKLPLMLHDSSSAKAPRLKKSSFVAAADGQISTPDYQVSSPASQISEGPVIRDVTDLMEDGRETSSTVDAGETWTRTHTSSTSSSGGSESAATPSASTSALAELDCAPIVASPLNPAEAMEPLCLLDPLDDADSASNLADHIEEVVAEEVAPSPKPVLSVSESQGMTSRKVPQNVAESVMQDFAPSELAKQPAVPDVKSAPSDLLGDCVMMEGIPSLMDESTTNTKTGLIESNWDSRLQESASPSAELGVPGPAKPVSSGGMQVALQDKATVKPKAFAEHLETIDTELDWLQDQLLSGGLNLDTSTLLGVCPDWTMVLSGNNKLFAPEDNLSSCLGDLATEGRTSDTVGNEMVQYTPSLLDLGLDDDPSFHQSNEFLLSDEELSARPAEDSAGSSSSIGGTLNPTSDNQGNPLSSVDSKTYPFPRTPFKKSAPGKKRRVASKK